MKKLLSVFIAVVMLLSLMTIAPAAFADEGFEAKLGFAVSDWSVSEWGDNVNTTVTGPGTYTLSWDLPEGTVISDALVFVVDVVGAGNAGLTVTDVAVAVDGNDVPVDFAKIASGDLEEKGNFRIEIYNEYGPTKADAPIDPAAVTAESNLTVTFTVDIAPAEGLVEREAKLGYAVSDWSVSEWGDNASTTVFGAGDYTVSWDLAEGTAVNDALVFVVDLIGAGADGYKLTALSVTADGKDIPVDMDKVITGDVEEKGNFRIEIYNEYGNTKADAPIDPAAVTASSNITVNFSLDVSSGLEPRETKLGYAVSDWSVSEWGDNASTVVEGAGTYTLSWDIPEGSEVADALVFVVDLIGAGSDGYKLTDLAVTADGNDIAVDLEKVATGDLEEKGNFRIEIYNEYGPTKADAPIDPASVTAKENLTITFTLDVDAVKAPAKAAVQVDPFDPNGTYNAYVGVQTPNWTYRDAWDSANGIGSEHWGDFIFGNETGEKYGVVTDAVVAGNGTYTVSVTDFGTIFADDFKTAGQDWFNLLYISTDIPLDGSVQITDVKLIIDGRTVHKYAEGFQDPDTAKYVKIMIQNIWNSDIAEISYYPAPTTSLEMSFTITGFDYDAQ